jgi:acyl-CoA reductase-like NAD-dependent aldehyde dehydrogenase
MVAEYKMYIKGNWVDAHSGKKYDDMNPYTGEVFARVAVGNKEDARKAIEAASAAFSGWSHTPPEKRRELFLKAADVLEKKRNEILAILIEETGCTFAFANFQLSHTPGLLREAAAQVTTTTGEIMPANLPGAFHMAIRQPVGVVAGISPWNAPVILSTRAVAMPMAFGNTVVLKPSTESAVAGGVVLAEIFHEAGFPPGVFNMVTNGPGGSDEIGEALISHPKVRRITFTGSTEVGRKLAEKAGRYLKRISLELGGKNPLIILKDADIDYAVNTAIFGSFFHQGQICMSAGEIIVEEAVYNEFIDKFVERVKKLKAGDPKREDVVVGPLVNANQLSKVKKQVDEAVKAGAKLLYGGKAEGLVYYPTVLTGVTRDMQAYIEEVFGPVAVVIPVKDAEEAIEVANDTKYGLSAAVITGDINKGLEIAEKVESGIFHINDQTVHDEPHVPLGGCKDSGFGRFGGKVTQEEFTELRWISIQRTPREFPF